MASSSNPHRGSSRGDDVRRLASRGIVLLLGREAFVRGGALIATIIVARLLGVHDFGELAFGLTLMNAALALSDGGLAAGLIRRADPPSSDELAIMTGLQLTILAAISAMSLAVLPVTGEAGLVTAIMACSLPFLAFQTPGQVLLERNLGYAKLARVEVAQNTIYQACAVGLAAAGLGPVGVAFAAFPRAIAASAFTMYLVKGSAQLPRFRFASARPLIRFGLQFQGVMVIGLARDQGINLGLAAVGGFGLLGIWSLAWRVLQVPFAFFQVLWRVSYPTVAAIARTGEDPAASVGRAVEVCSAGTALIAAPMFASVTGLTPLFFGDAFQEAAPIVMVIVLGLVVSAPISVGVAGYLSVSQAMREMYITLTASSVVWLGFTLPAVSMLGPIAIAIGQLLGGLTEALLFAEYFKQRSGAWLLRRPFQDLAVATLGGASGLAIATALGGGPLAASCGALAALAVTGIGLRFTSKDRLQSIVALVRMGITPQPAA